MNYFLTHKLYSPISAIEKAMIARLALFNKHGYQATFVTRDYNREIASLLKQHGMSAQSYLNMFDFFQGFSGEDRAPISRTVQIEHDGMQLSDDGLQETFYWQDRVVAIVIYRRNDKSIDTISYYGPNNKVANVDLYDNRGWLSMTQLLDDCGRVHTQLFWNQRHELVYMEQYGTLADGQWGNRSMQLHFHDQIKFFNSLEQLFAYFLDELVRKDSKAVFFADRHETAVESLCEMALPAKKYLVMHSSHLVDTQSQQITIWLQKALDNAFSGIIVSTEKQAEDLRKVIRLPVFTVPVRYLTEAELHRPRTWMAQEKLHSLLVVARLSEEKRVGDAIEALSLVHSSVPDATLDIFGAPMAGYVEQKKLINLVKSLGLEQQVSFKGFKESLDDIYPGHSAMIVTSKVEGFNISILEAQSYGIPVVTYAIDYGPTTLVVNDQNGVVVSQNQPSAVAQAIVTLWQNESRMDALSEGAYDSCERYSEGVVWEDWLKVLEVSE